MHASRNPFHDIAHLTPQQIGEDAMDQVREVRAVLAARAAQGRWSPERDARLALQCVEKLAVAVERIAMLSALHSAEIRAIGQTSVDDCAVQFATYRRQVGTHRGEPIYELRQERTDLSEALAFCGWEFVADISADIPLR